ncbi:MAG: PIG-L family deacetylase [Corynebacteriales bacterium]|nr:PIG-L family deacetylase [Mycobacteriales bacterium]
MSDQLDPFPADWSRALAVVAHPDDLEYGAAGAIAQWTAQDRTVAYLLASQGEAGIDSIAPAQAGPLRVAEQRASAAIVGVGDVEFLNYPDGLIERTVSLRGDIARAIRRHRPDLVVTINHHPTWGPGFLNQSDHINVGSAVFDAVRDAANRWLFPEPGIEPWSGVRWVAVAGSPQPTHAVNIDDTIELAVASLEAHREYLLGLGDHPMARAEEFLRQFAEQTGERFGGGLATSFEVVPM